MEKPNPHTALDSAWKDIIEELFEDFLTFFFPAMHADIDFSKGYTFLDKELQKIEGSAAVGKRFADKLVKLLDFGDRRADLADSANPFALVVETVLRYIEQKGNVQRIYNAKKQLLTMLFERKYTKRRIEALLKFIDWMLQLPTTLEQQIEDDIIEVRGGTGMPYVTSWERIAAAKAAKEATEKTRERTIIETARKMLAKGLDFSLTREITGLSEEKIMELQAESQQSDTEKE